MLDRLPAGQLQKPIRWPSCVGTVSAPAFLKNPECNEPALRRLQSSLWIWPTPASERHPAGWRL